MAAKPSLKRIQIDKAAKSIVVVTGVAVFIVIFCAFSGKVLLSQLAYQNRVETAKQKSLTQLKSDVTAEHSLDGSYQKFVDTPKNIIGGDSTNNTGGSDGNNAKVILDALPSTYDFPALATSLQYLLTSQNVTIDSITGVDLGVSSATGTAAAAAPATTSVTSTVATNLDGATAMPFSISVDGPYQNVENLILAFQHSIRPIQILSIDLSGNQADLSATISAQTFYQPETQFQITTEAIK